MSGSIRCLHCGGEALYCADGALERADALHAQLADLRARLRAVRLATRYVVQDQGGWDNVRRALDLRVKRWEEE